MRLAKQAAFKPPARCSRPQRTADVRRLQTAATQLVSAAGWRFSRTRAHRSCWRQQHSSRLAVRVRHAAAAALRRCAAPLRRAAAGSGSATTGRDSRAFRLLTHLRAAPARPRRDRPTRSDAADMADRAGGAPAGVLHGLCELCGLENDQRESDLVTTHCNMKGCEDRRAPAAQRRARRRRGGRRTGERCVAAARAQ
jgi:hypothetical protein